MKFPWHSVEAKVRSVGSPAAYESMIEVASESFPGVSFTVLRMSFGRRMELFRSIRTLAGQIAFLESSSDFREQVEANLLGQEIENLYLRWGLADVRGLAIDGEAASTESLIERGPEGLSREIVRAVRAQCGLTDEERKN